MVERPLHVLAPIDRNAGDLSSMILPLVASRPLCVTLFRVGDGENLRESARIFRMRGLPVEQVRGDGPTAREIVLMAKANRCDLIAMLTHGRRGLSRAVLGSVAEDVLRASPVPVLLGKPGAAKGSWNHVVAALDGSARAERILPWASRLAKVAGTPLRLIRVGDGPEARDYLARTGARLERKGVAALPVQKRGDPARAVTRYARDIGAGLICVTTTGRTGLRRLLLGSVAEEIIRRSPCPVLALRG